MILVLGASGMLGSVLCKMLMQQGHQLKAVTRNPEKFNKAEYPTLEIVYADLTRPETLMQLFSGVDTVITCAHSLLGNGKNVSYNVDYLGHKKLIDLCAENKVKHFIYTSMYGANANTNVDFIKYKYETEQYLAQSGMAYTVIRPTAFMELHAQKLIGESVLKKGKVKLFGYGKNLYNYVSVNDVARLISEKLQQTPGNKTIEIGSPENITRIDVAKLYGKYIGKEPRISSVSPKTLRFLSGIIRPFHKGISGIMKMSAEMDESDYTYDYSINASEFSFTPVSIDTFIKSQVDLHNQN